MTEDLEQQKRVEDEAKRQIRDQEVEKILKMNKEEREQLYQLCTDNERHFQRRSSAGELELLAFDSEDPSIFEMGGAKVNTKKLKKKSLLKFAKKMAISFYPIERSHFVYGAV